MEGSSQKGGLGGAAQMLAVTAMLVIASFVFYVRDKRSAHSGRILRSRALRGVSKDRCLHHRCTPSSRQQGRTSG